MNLLSDNARIGIINRGEAACRFIRAIHDYNTLYGKSLKAIAFYGNEEKNALFVQEADFSYALQDFVHSDSDLKRSMYLNHELLIRALEGGKCEAVWVGWGFVSEDAEFVEKLEKARFIFLGPKSNVMRLVGDKISSKELAKKTKTPICQWSEGPVTTLEDAYKAVDRIGYPCIIKASNAGGGRGIRIVFNENQIAQQYCDAVEETFRITGNRLVYIEQLIEMGRHLEVQVIADYHGNVKTFGVRDCSLQRKNQKIIEETPPSHLDSKTIESIEKVARDLLKEAGYYGAGTVEFLYDLETNKFYFMEVNARLQVEHPITEQLYNVDLAVAQIVIATGASITDYGNEFPRGHVIEVRLNAEDPENDFRPSGGLVSCFKMPGGLGVRVDSGIQSGSFISSSFDSMVAKIIVTATNRDQALARLYRALREMQVTIEGGSTNRTFLLELLQLEEIKRGGVSTRFIQSYLEKRKKPSENVFVAFFVAACEFYLIRDAKQQNIWHQQMIFNGYSRILRSSFKQEISLKYQGVLLTLQLRRLSEILFVAEIDDNYFYLEYYKAGRNTFIFKGQKFVLELSFVGNVLRVEVNDVPYLLESDEEGMLSAPVPGLVLYIKVDFGTFVNKGDVILTLEAMKMEIPVIATYDGYVGEIYVKPGEHVSSGQNLVKFEKKKVSNSEPKTELESQIFTVPSSDKINALVELSAFVTGYDALSSDRLFSLCSYQKTPEVFLSFLKLYADFLQIFSEVQLNMGGYTSNLSYQQLLINYYRSYERSEKDFPLKFLQALSRVFEHFSTQIGKGLQQDYILYRCYRFAASMQEIAIFVAKIMPQLGEYADILMHDPQWSSPVLSEIFNSIGRHVESLRSLCAGMRYQLVEYPPVESLLAMKLDKYERNIRLLKNKNSDKNRQKLLAKAVSYGSQSESWLVKKILTKNQHDICLEVLSHRMHRDFQILQYEELIPGKMASIFYTDRESVRRCSSILVIERSQEMIDLLTHIEADLVLVFMPQKICIQEVKIENCQIKYLSCGIMADQKGLIYENYVFCNNEWKFNEEYGFLSPLFYRELYVYRLLEFSKHYLQIARGIVLTYAQHKVFQKDERFFLFINVEVVQVQLDDDQKVKAIVGFEDRLLKGISVLQDAQLRHTRRLPWNRIVISVRPTLRAPWSEIEEYARAKVSTYLGNGFGAGLGLESVSVYLYDEQQQRHELLISEFLDGSVRCERRLAKTTPLKVLDNYTSKVSLCRSRRIFYPYEVIKNLEEGYFGLPKASFEEFEFTSTSEGMFSYKSVKGRPYASNTANIVFGIIEMFFDDDQICRRVLVLSDPSGNMGSLAERECCHVNAALQLAKDRKIPVEWITTSSGALIDMKSGTENLDWTAYTLREIVEFTQKGGEINVIVAGTNVGAQSYWNSEATMLMHCCGILIMTSCASMLLTGKKALDFSGSISAENNLGIGGALSVMLPNGEAQFYVRDIGEAYELLWHYYNLCYVAEGKPVRKVKTEDSSTRDIGKSVYCDEQGQGFTVLSDVFSKEFNNERKKPFDMRQLMQAVIDADIKSLERWKWMQNAEMAIVWHARMGGVACGLIGIESRQLTRHGYVPYDGPIYYAGGTLYPKSSKKVARAINSFSGRVPLVILANLSGFDGSPESLRNEQLEWGAEIGRAVVNFSGPLLFFVVGRYHGGAYVVFSKALNKNMKTFALEGSYASVIGGAPAAAVVFSGKVKKAVYTDPRIVQAKQKLNGKQMTASDFDDLYKSIYSEKQTLVAQEFDQAHSIERAKHVGSIDEIIRVDQLRSTIINFVGTRQ